MPNSYTKIGRKTGEFFYNAKGSLKCFFVVCLFCFPLSESRVVGIPGISGAYRSRLRRGCL